MNVGTGSSTNSSSSNTIALTAAAIGFVSAIASGTLGFDHAKSAYDAALGGTAGFDDYVTVGNAFWDAVPVGAAFAVTAGLLAYGVQLSAAYYRFGAGIVAVGASALGASLDAPKHLQGYLAVTNSGASDTATVLSVFWQVYGGLAWILAAIAGLGIGIAIGTKAADAQ
jgi:hypothetical protein